MSLVASDVETYEQWLERRRDAGADRWDEVWDGVEVMAPPPNSEHQDITDFLLTCLFITVDFANLGKARSSLGLSDRVEDWVQNHRVPDLVVFLNGSPATNHGTHWTGSPDFVVEVISRYDRSREKLGFYEAIGTREVLLVDRYPWSLELYRLQEGRLVLVGRSTVASPIVLSSEALPPSFRLVGGKERPSLEVIHSDGIQNWSI